MRQLLGVAVLALTALPAIASQGAAPLTLLGPICHAEPLPAIVGPHKLVMLPGMGNDRMAADTANPEAQAWFDYGLTLGRSFEHGDAVLAFQKAEALDPTCSLCVWGEAWAHGPTINFGVPPAQRAADLVLAKRAVALARPDVATKIRWLEGALVARYQGDPGAGDRAYAGQLDAMNRADPADVEIAVADAEAWLILGKGGDATGPMRAVKVLQPLVPTHPDASGLVHFFIHATEQAGQPELAEPYAARLAKLAPAASHMVHMPSHTFFRVGRYEEAAQSNLAALAADRAYAEHTNYPTPLGHVDYHGHDLHFGLVAALTSGDGPAALQLVSQFNQDFPSPAYASHDDETLAGVAYAALGRFAATEMVLAAPDTAAGNPFLQAMRHYARGEAELRLKRVADLRAEAAQVHIPSENTFFGPQPVEAVLTRIARLTLQGDADLLDGQPDAAITAFTQAAALQDARLGQGGDPPSWWFPARRDLAAALLAKGDAAGAAAQASAVLLHWCLDPISLEILARAQQALKSPEAATTLTAAQTAWRGDPGVLAGMLS
jgi:tetratricopeptide (TPR) repeat protein